MKTDINRWETVSKIKECAMVIGIVHHPSETYEQFVERFKKAFDALEFQSLIAIACLELYAHNNCVFMENYRFKKRNPYDEN